MSIVDLYKEHINPDADGLEIHKFMKTYNLDEVLLLDPSNSRQNLIDQIDKLNNKIKALEWILKNRKKD